VVEDVRLGLAPTTQNPMVIWKLRIIGPHYTGQTLTKTRIITAKTLAYVKEDLAHLGVVLDRFSDLGERLAEMIECEVGVYKRQGRNGWTDVFFTRRREPWGPRAEQAQAAAATGPTTTFLSDRGSHGVAAAGGNVFRGRSERHLPATAAQNGLTAAPLLRRIASNATR
jgi:hypothetical protein